MKNFYIFKCGIYIDLGGFKLEFGDDMLSNVVDFYDLLFYEVLIVIGYFVNDDFVMGWVVSFSVDEKGLYVIL